MLRFLYYTQLDTQRSGTIPLNERSARRTGRYLHKTQQMNIQVFGGIQTHDRSNQAVCDVRLRKHGRWDQHAPSVYFIVTCWPSESHRLKCTSRGLYTYGHKPFSGKNTLAVQKMFRYKSVKTCMSQVHTLYRIQLFQKFSTYLRANFTAQLTNFCPTLYIINL